MILFVFIWFCTVLLLDGWDLHNIYIIRGVMFCYVVSTPLFIYWSRLKNHDDRLIMIWFLGANWLLSVCFVFLFSYPAHVVYMLLTVLASYLAMARLEYRVWEGAYWEYPPGNEGFERDASLALCFIAVALLAAVGSGIYMTIVKDNRQFLMPSSTAFHFAVSLYLASEYVLYSLNKFGLLVLVDGKEEEIKMEMR